MEETIKEAALAHIETILKPIFETNSDVTCAGGFLVLDPVTHVCRRILTKQASADDQVYLEWAVDILFLKDSTNTVSGVIAAKDAGPFRKTVSLPKNSISKTACIEIEGQHMPLLRRLNSLEACYEYLMNRARPISISPELHFPLELAMGNIDAAHMLRRWHRQRWFDRPVDTYGKESPIYSLVQRLCLLLEADDIAEVPHVLREAEEAAAKELGLNHLWRPTTFPVEYAP